jgi:hypothetical protein
MAKAEKGTAYLTGYNLKPKGRMVRELTLRNIENPSSREFPKDFHTLYYGAQTTLRQMSKVHAEAIRNKQDLYQITVAVDVDNIIVEFLTFEDLKKTRMMNMERISKEVSEKIQDYWWGYLKDEGLSDQWIKDNVEWRRHRFMSDRPDLIEHLAKEPEFKHLSMIIYQVVDTEKSDIYKVATIVNPQAVKSATCKSHPDIPVTIEELAHTA